MKLGRIIVAALIAGSAACSLFVDLDGLTSADGGSAPDGSFDATSSDSAIGDANSPADAAIDTGPPFDCTSSDATFCDDFNRDTPIAAGNTPWSQVICTPGGSISADGGLVTSFGASNADDHCYLESMTTAISGHFTLDFDMTFATADTTSSAPITVTSVTLNLGTPNALGIENESFQFLVDGRGHAQLGVVSYFPDAAASPHPPNSFIYSDLATMPSFVPAGALCHVTLDVDTITPKGSGTSVCNGVTRALIASSDTSQPGFKAPTTVEFGFENTNGPAPAWSITYDNMVFRRAP
ncbi:MAG: hypothetical protein ABI461_15060 [Polyangiaceae bacterium]